MENDKYRKCPYCKTKTSWLKLFNVKTSEGEDVKSNCPICNEDFCLDGVPSCGHSVCNKCFSNLEKINYYNHDDNDLSRYMTPPPIRRRYDLTPPAAPRRVYHFSDFRQMTENNIDDIGIGLG